MEEKNISVFFALLGSVLKNENINENDVRFVTDESIRAMLKLAKKHDIAVLVSYALEKNQIEPKDLALRELLQSETMMSVVRYQRINYELLAVCKVLEKNRIKHIALKGSTIRKYYPKPWLRTSCDIDILVCREDLGRAVECIVSELGYTKDGEGSHDISMFSGAGVHLELHFDLNEPTGKSYRTLDEVWKYATCKSEGGYTYELADEFFYFYHIAHMAKHFMIGGCGIRPFFDLWILNHIVEASKEKRNELLDCESLRKFCDSVTELSEVWFSQCEHNNLTAAMEDYLLCGGVYGSTENRVRIQQSKSGGKLKYAVSRIFLPYEQLKYHYPVLQKHKWLTPFMEVRRWFKLLFRGGASRSVKELKANSAITKEQAEKTQILLNEIGL